MQITIETYRPELGTAIEELQNGYIAANPQGTKFVPKELYNHHPALEKGRNVICAFVKGRVPAGYGALFPTPAEPASPPEVANTIWIHIRVDPQSVCLEEIQEALYQAIFARSLTYSRAWQDRRTRIAISYPAARDEELAFFEAKGFEKFDALLQMTRDLTKPIPPITLPPGIVVRGWRMATREEKKAYALYQSMGYKITNRAT